MEYVTYFVWYQLSIFIQAENGISLNLLKHEETIIHRLRTEKTYWLHVLNKIDNKLLQWW